MERSADNRIRTTEWEDIQYKHGNRVGKYQTQELEILTQRLADKHQNAGLRSYDPQQERLSARYEQLSDEDDDCNSPGSSKQLELSRSGRGNSDVVTAPYDAEDDDGNDDDVALMRLRRQRLREMKEQEARNCFGVLRHIAGSDYIAEVTEASQHNWVVAALVKPAHNECEVLLNLLRAVAQKQRAIKFVSIISTEAIPAFPDKHLPCVLLYHNKSLVQQITGLDAWRRPGVELGVMTVECNLRQRGVELAE